MTKQRVTQANPAICGWINWEAGRICGQPTTHTEESHYSFGIVAVSSLCNEHTLTPKGQ